MSYITSGTKDPKPKGLITTTFYMGGQEFDPDLFSSIVNCQPTEVWRAWAQGVKGNPLFPQIEWRHKVRRQPFWSLDEAICSMLTRFEPHQRKITLFAREYKCSLHLRCEMHGDETTIIYQVEPSTMNRLGVFGCSLSLSIDSEGGK